ncbi:type II CAAX prenyl endopeptidase Rce1 family protein [Clostridium sp.]|uniref:CPBP family glutamic-type intramembrane protease n=1 Tax=Clostridium sp. TaxID=1506 RepID=UPI0037BF39FE
MKRIYKKLNKNIFTGLLIIGVIPILEEIIFKYYLLKYVMEIFILNVYVEGIIFIVINAIVFTIAHISTQKIKAIIKIVFSIISSIIFILINNIYICIIIHIIFNAIVYISTISKYSGRIN